MLYGYRKVDDGFLIRRGLPHIQNGVAHLQRVFRLGSGEALRAVLETEIAFGLVRQLLQKLRACLLYTSRCV